MALSPGLVPESTTLLVTSLHTLSGHMRTAIALMRAKQLNAAGTHERLQLLVQNTAQFGIVRKESSKQMFAAGQEWFNTCMARGAPGATDLEAATSQCAAAYAALIGAAVAEMQTLDNSLASAQQARSNVDKVKLFVAIWLCACSTSEWWTSWDSFCAACSAPLDLTALQPVLTTFMTWLLGFMRQGSHMCHALPPYYGRAGPDRQQTNIYACMSTALLLLRIQKAQPSAEVCAAVANLPSSLLPTLCQLACEVCPSSLENPSAHSDPHKDTCIKRYSKLLYNLQDALLGLVNAHAPILNSAVTNSPALLGSSTLEVLKRAISVFCSTPNTPAGYLDAALYTLSRLLLYSQAAAELGAPLDDRRLHFQPHRDPPNSSRCSDGGSSTSTSATSRATLPHLKPDTDLLALVARCAIQHPAIMERSTSLMNIVVIGWREHHGSTAVASFATILHHCSYHLRRAMQQRRQPSAAQPTVAPNPPVLADGLMSLLLPCMNLYSSTLVTMDGELRALSY